MYLNITAADNIDEEGLPSPCWAASYFKILPNTPAAPINHNNKDFNKARYN
jgi:hypothetical protein